MWFWAGLEVKASEIADVPAYNRANGRMWIVYSLIFWAAAFAGLWSGTLAVGLIVVGCALGLPDMIGIYNRIYNKYMGLRLIVSRETAGLPCRAPPKSNAPPGRRGV